MNLTVGEWLGDRLEEIKENDHTLKSTDDLIKAFNLSRSNTYKLLKNKKKDVRINYKTYYTFGKHLAKGWILPTKNELREYIENNCVRSTYRDKCITCGKVYGEEQVTNTHNDVFYEVYVNNHKDKFPSPICYGNYGSNSKRYRIFFCKSCIETVVDVLLTPYNKIVKEFSESGKSQTDIAELREISTNQGLISRIMREDLQEQYINPEVALGLNKELIKSELEKTEDRNFFFPILKFLYSKGYKKSDFYWNFSFKFSAKTIEYKPNQNTTIPLLIKGIAGRNIACFVKEKGAFIEYALAAEKTNSRYFILLEKSYDYVDRKEKNLLHTYILSHNGVYPCGIPPFGKSLLDKILAEAIISSEKPEPQNSSLKYMTSEICQKISLGLNNPDQHCENDEDIQFFSHFMQKYPGGIAAVELYKICEGDDVVAKHFKLISEDT